MNVGTGKVTTRATRKVTVSGSTITVGGVIGGGSVSLTKAGGGALTLSGANTFTGGVTLSAGTLNINNASALGTGTFTIGGSSTIDSTATFTNQLLTTNNLQSWNADFTFTGTNNLNLGTGAVTMGANRQVTVGANTLTVGGAIGDGGNTYSLTKAGPGALTLSGTSTY